MPITRPNRMKAMNGIIALLLTLHGAREHCAIAQVRQNPSAEVISLTGRVFYKTNRLGNWSPLKLQSRPGSTNWFRTETRASLTFRLASGDSVVHLKEETEAGISLQRHREWLLELRK